MSIDKIVGVYAIINPKNQIYVGSSNDVNRRFYQYRGLHEPSQTKLFNSLKKYGVDNHKFIIIEQCNLEELYKKERAWGEELSSLDRHSGLNLCLPGFGEVKKAMSEQTKIKIGNAHKGKKISNKQKSILLKAVMGKKQTPQHIEKRKKFGEENPAYGKQGFFKGKKHKEETIKLFSENRKGKKLLGENSNAKKVIDNKTREVYSSAKEVSIKFKINYSTLRAWLQNINGNDGRFEYANKNNLL